MAAADRRKIGDLFIGQVVAHAQQDSDGTWPTLADRNALERYDRDDVRRGFADGIYNKRGVTMRGLTDGGKQEYELADSFDNWAALLSDKWPRTAAVLREVAADYRAQGRREDERARLVVEGMDA